MTENGRWWSPPRSIEWLLLVYLLSAVCVAAFPDVVTWLALVSPNDPVSIRILGVITYPLVTIGLKHWGEVALLTWLPAVVLKSRLSGRDMLLSLAVASVIGGVVFYLTTAGTTLVGGGLAAWGLAGAAVSVGFRKGQKFGAWRRLYQLASAAALVITAFSPSGYDFAILAAALAGGVVGFLRSRATTSEEVANFA